MWKMEGKASAQDEYLKKVIAERAFMRVLLTGGKDIKGLIKACDAFTIVMEVSGMEVLVYKSAIAAIGPSNRPGT